MNRKVSYIFFAVLITVLSVYFFKHYSKQEKSNHNTAVNEKVVQVKSFSVNSESTELQTSVKGTLFIKSDKDVAEHIQIVASIKIDPKDWGGIGFYIPDKWYISNIQSSYPENKSKIKLSDYVSTWTPTEKNYKWSGIVEVGRAHNFISTGGGTGFVVIDLMPKKALNRSEKFSILVAVGSDEKNGNKILGPDYIEIPISITPSK
ncbi:hypothetical protein [Paenibacillus sp. 2TAB19]|uniref:hypothetical protein n=1 Tax=Paenibacillus sp. 2TAB19 TaxID=3233003 RepID=UPI003F94D100